MKWQRPKPSEPSADYYVTHGRLSLAMKWKRYAYHAESECGRWIVNWTGGDKPVFMLVRKPGEIVKVGTKQECLDAARGGK